MEVVMMEYTIASFIPVIVAAVTSTLVTQIRVRQHEPAFTVAPLHMHSLFEIPLSDHSGAVMIGCGRSRLYPTDSNMFANLSERAGTGKEC